MFVKFLVRKRPTKMTKFQISFCDDVIDIQLLVWKLIAAILDVIAMSYKSVNTAMFSPPIPQGLYLLLY